MRRTFWAGVLAAMLLVCLGMPVHASPSAVLQEQSTVYNLDAAKLAAIFDPEQSRDVVVTGEGVTLTPDASAGSYISLPVEMPEFSKLSMTWSCYYTTKDAQPAVSVSVYRPKEQTWSDWILLPDGKSAGREKGEPPNLLIRYRVDLSRADASGEAMLLENILVTGGERFFTESNLVLLLIMGSALVIYLIRKKKYGTQVFRLRKK